MFPRLAARCLDADAAIVALLRSEVGDLRVLGSAAWYPIAEGDPGEEVYVGTLKFALAGSLARLEFSLGDGPCLGIETLRAGLARRLATGWLAVASDGALALDAGPPAWGPVERARSLGQVTEPWHGRSFAFDAHLAQLMSQPLGMIELAAPESVFRALDAD